MEDPMEDPMDDPIKCRGFTDLEPQISICLINFDFKSFGFILLVILSLKRRRTISRRSLVDPKRDHIGPKLRFSTEANFQPPLI